MFKGPKPAAQPRSLRSIAESKNAGAGFMDEMPFDNQAGVPTGVPGIQGTYADAGNDATLGGHSGQLPAASPFANIRGGKT